VQGAGCICCICCTISRRWASWLPECGSRAIEWCDVD
jgi:hypothetical protein